MFIYSKALYKIIFQDQSTRYSKSNLQQQKQNLFYNMGYCFLSSYIKYNWQKDLTSIISINKNQKKKKNCQTLKEVTTQRGDISYISYPIFEKKNNR